GSGVSSSGMFDPSLAGIGTHTINYTLGADPCISSTNIEITVLPSPFVSLSDSAICLGNSVELIPTASSGVSYLWSTGETTPTITVSPTVTTTYEVTVITADGCEDTDTVTVTLNPSPTIDAGEDVTICMGDSTTLTAIGSGAGAINYLWDTGETTPNITVSPLVTTTYEVLVTEVNGCENIDTVTVTVSSVDIDITEDLTICYGENTTLTASGGVDYVWNTGAVTSSITVSPLVTTTYEVLVTDVNGCENTAEVTVTVNPLPLADAGENVTICMGESATLTASGGIQYLWNANQAASSIPVSPNFSTTSVITVSPLVTTTYEVLVTDLNGCENTAEVTVTVNPLPIADAGEDVVICYGESTTLTASGGVDYVWSTGATTSEITVSPLVTTTYEVLVIDANGCENTAEVTVTVNPLP